MSACILNGNVAMTPQIQPGERRKNDWGQGEGNPACVCKVKKQAQSSCEGDTNLLDTSLSQPRFPHL